MPAAAVTALRRRRVDALDTRRLDRQGGSYHGGDAGKQCRARWKCQKVWRATAMGDAFTREPHGVAPDVSQPISETFRRAGTGGDTFKARVEFEAIAGRDAVAAFVCDWQAAEFPHSEVLEFEFFTDGRTVAP